MMLAQAAVVIQKKVASNQIPAPTPPSGNTQCKAYAANTHEEDEHLAAGGYFSMFIDDSGKLWSWGSNINGQLGQGNIKTISKPVEVTTTGNDEKWIGVTAGTKYTIAWKADGSMWGWGVNDRYQLATSLRGTVGTSTVGTSTPVKISYNATAKIKKIIAGNAHVLAIDEQDMLYGWGDNTDYQLVTSAASNASIPSNAAGFHTITAAQGAKVVDIAAGAAHSLAILDNGMVYGVGSNKLQQLAKNNRDVADKSSKPMQIMCNVKHIAAGGGTSFAIDTANKLWGWGDNSKGQLAQDPSTDFDPSNKTNTQKYTHKPQQITATLSGTKVEAWHDVVVGSQYVLAIDEKNRYLWIWGKGGNAVSTSSTQYEPQQIGGSATWKAIAVGGAHVLALKENGGTKEIWGLGANKSGQLGTATGAATTLTKIYP